MACTSSSSASRCALLRGPTSRGAFRRCGAFLLIVPQARCVPIPQRTICAGDPLQIRPLHSEGEPRQSVRERCHPREQRRWMDGWMGWANGWTDVRRRALRSSSRLDSTERAPAGCTDSSIHYSFAERYAVRVRVIVCVCVVISCPALRRNVMLSSPLYISVARAGRTVTCSSRPILCSL